MTRKEEFLQKSKYFEYMIPAEGTEFIERTNDFVWLEDSGLYCSVPKETQILMSLEEFEKDIQFWRDLMINKERFTVISVINPGTKSNKEQREIAANVLPELFNALAVISPSALGRMALKIFLGIKELKARHA